MTNICPVCNTANGENAYSCRRCTATLTRSLVDEAKRSPGFGSFLLKRLGTIAMVCAAILAGFYISLIGSAKKLQLHEREEVNAAIDLLEAKGFSNEVFFLRHMTAFRASDNWLNASVAKENAYAATNFPFEIMTLYPDFFTYPSDDTERAAILLHEARHLQGKDERDAYAFVWKNREKLGWTSDHYSLSEVWLNVRKQTRETVPEMFNCENGGQGDCPTTAP